MFKRGMPTHVQILYIYIKAMFYFQFKNNKCMAFERIVWVVWFLIATQRSGCLLVVTLLSIWMWPFQLGSLSSPRQLGFPRQTDDKKNGNSILYQQNPKPIVANHHKKATARSNASSRECLRASLRNTVCYSFNLSYIQAFAVRYNPLLSWHDSLPVLQLFSERWHAASSTQINQFSSPVPSFSLLKKLELSE